jgi:hypothetical protein
MLIGLFGGGGVRVFSAGRRPDAAGFDPLEQELLLQHAALGCISLWCTHAQSAYPFVFRTRLVKSAIPCAQLIYCRGTAPKYFRGPLRPRLGDLAYTEYALLGV